MVLIRSLSLLLCVFIVCGGLASASEVETFKKMTFKLDGRNCILIAPEVPAEGRPWIWRTEFFGHQPQVDWALVEQGFHLAYIQMSGLYGSPAAIEVMEKFYQHMTGTFTLSPKPILEGFSRGGLYAFNYAAAYPEQVGALYLDAAVLDINSWPGRFKNDAQSAYQKNWVECLQRYGLNEAEAATAKVSPIDKIDQVAAAQIPIIAVVGDLDSIVPVAENTALLEKRYRELGAPITVIHKPFSEHHPHSLTNPKPVVDFLVQSVAGELADSSVLVAGTPFGYDYFVPRGGLPNSRVVFERGEQARVAFLGGSITAMNGWRDLVQAELVKRFPATEFDFVDAGVPSMDSTYHAFRLSRDVLGDGPVDLLFVEAAVNDSTNGRSSVEQLRGMEGIVRQARLANPYMDMVLLHFVDPDKMQSIEQGRRPEVIVNHEKVAARYGIPSIDLAQEVTERIFAGEFNWEEDFKNLHPSPFGHELYAQSIARLMDAVWTGAPPAQTTIYTLPAPLDRNSYFNGRILSPATAELGDGFRMYPEWMPADGANTRAGFVSIPMAVSETAGSVLKFSFSGTGVGIVLIAGPDAGAIEYRMDGGPAKPWKLFTRWSHRLHLPWVKMLFEDLPHGEHLLELKVTEDTHPESKGQAVRIVNFLVQE